jgi:hypothetical protein
MSLFNRFKIRLKKINRKKSHSRTSKFIIIFVILSLFTYTGFAMWVQIRSGVELSPTLTTCFYAFCTGELWLLASIKKAKLNNGQKSRAYDNEIDNYKGEGNIEDDGEAKG